MNCDIGVGGGTGLIGHALVPYYRQLLPIMNIFINNTENLGKYYCISKRVSLELLYTSENSQIFLLFTFLFITSITSVLFCSC